jgi:Fe-S oxidoreductase
VGALQGAHRASQTCEADVTVKPLRDFRNHLYGCRFCTMCKPAGEVSNQTQLESHTTRGRALLLWRVAEYGQPWGPRDVELLYQSTLDSISQAFCVVDYAVSEYVAAARAEVYAGGLAPATVTAALQRRYLPCYPSPSDTVVLAGDAAELDDFASVSTLESLLKRTGTRASGIAAPSGVLAYALGAIDLAREQAREVIRQVIESGAVRVVADSPDTLWALRRLYPEMGVALPESVEVTSLTELLASAWAEGRLRLPNHGGQKVFFHDSRSAFQLGERSARAEAVQPGFRGPETMSGEGEIYEAPRRLLAALNLTPCYNVWSRALSRSCGADDGLWRTYPVLARDLAQARLAQVKTAGAARLVTDSLLAARWLAQAWRPGDPAVSWLPELL